MPRYPYRDLGTGLGRDFRNNLNANFDDIEADLRDIQNDLNTKDSAAHARMTQIENDSIERDNDLDARIDNLILSAGDSSPEVADARYDSRTNTTYPTLKDRLDAHSDEIGILSNSATPMKFLNAVGDGLTDDSTPLNQGLDSVGSIDLLGLVYAANSNLLASTLRTNDSYKVIKNGVIDGKGVSGFTLQNKSKLYFKNVKFKNLNYINLINCNDIWFFNCEIENMKTNGIIGGSGNNRIYVLNCRFNNIGTGTIDPTWQGMGVTVGGDSFVIRWNEFLNTYGQGAIHVNGGTNFIIENNYIHDTFYRGINLYGNSNSGIIRNNIIKRCGFINTTNSGVGCNGIFASGNNQAVDVIGNIIIDVYENGIEGNFGNVDRNYIKNTGIDTVNKPTTSIEGIYANGLSYKNNIIVNPKGSAIKLYSTGTISNLEIIGNQLFGASGTTTTPIDINSTNSYTNVKIIGNEFHNYSQGIALSNKPKTNVIIRDNRNYSNGVMLNSFNGAFVVESRVLGIKNARFRDWASTAPDYWTTRNTSVSKVVENGRNIAVVTPANATYTGGLWQDVYNDYESCNITIKTSLKGTVPARISVTPYTDAGGIDDPNVIFIDVTPDSANYNEYVFSVSNLTRDKYRIQVGPQSTDNTKNISIQYIECFVGNNKQ